jgi:thiamine transport system ATP-binding protein
MSALTLQQLSVRYGRMLALDRVTLHVADGDILVLLGASGSGKSTLLRVIAGLEPPYTGDVYIGARRMHGVPPEARGVGMVFQDFALFPHLSVLENVAYGLRMRGQPREQRTAHACEVLAMVGLDGYGARSIDALSGGERQRVALARALAPQPAVLLLDEPLGSLDRLLREQLADDLRVLLKRLGTTAISVTHDQQEALRLADTVAILKAGRIEQHDAVQTVFRRPRTRYVAAFLGHDNLLGIDAWYRLAGSIHLRDEAALDAPDAGSILIHDDAIHVTPDSAGTARLAACRFRGDHFALHIDVPVTDGQTLQLVKRVSYREGTQFAVHQRVMVEIETAGVHVLPPNEDEPA